MTVSDETPSQRVQVFTSAKALGVELDVEQVRVRLQPRAPMPDAELRRDKEPTAMERQPLPPRQQRRKEPLMQNRNYSFALPRRCRLTTVCAVHSLDAGS